MTIPFSEQHSLRQIYAKVHEESGLQVEKLQQAFVQARLRTFLQQNNYSNFNTLWTHINHIGGKVILEKVIDTITVQESYFFRDPSLFQALRQTIIPNLIKRNSHLKRLRLWSAGCSTGQECCSLGILLKQHFPVLDSWDVQILGSDISQTALTKAATGQYSVNELSRGLSPEQQQYFSTNGTLKPSIRQNIRFRHMNLAQPYYLTEKMDLILLRNVLYYLSPARRHEALQRIAQYVQGYLSCNTIGDHLSGLNRLKIHNQWFYTPLSGSP